MGFVSFFVTGRSYASPYFILTVPVGAIGYYLLWRNGAPHAWHATKSSNRRVGAVPKACVVDGILMISFVAIRGNGLLLLCHIFRPSDRTYTEDLKAKKHDAVL